MKERFKDSLEIAGVVLSLAVGSASTVWWCSGLTSKVSQLDKEFDRVTDIMARIEERVNNLEDKTSRIEGILN